MQTEGGIRVHCAGAMRNIRRSARPRTVCDRSDTAAAPLSVAYGRMGRMSQDRTSGDRAGAVPASPVTAELPEYAERVLDVADLIPPGRVMTYGDVAEWLGDGGPRQVGRVMALYGSAVPWWRVVRADGVLLPGHEQRALGHYREEGTPLRTAPRDAEGHVPRVDMRRARWDGGTDGPGEEAHT